LHKRKLLLEEFAHDLPEGLRLLPALEGSGAKIAARMQQLGLEGIIAKRRDSLYEAGRRSGAWIKYKWVRQQEFVIGGYTPPKGSRSYFGSLLIGYFDEGKLMYASRVGTGFSDKLLSKLYDQLRPAIRRDCPFANLPEPRMGRWRQGITAAEMKKCVWVEPRLVCQVKFAEWTRDDHLRQPAFIGLRTDKSPTEVVRELAQSKAA
jgi:bifunctional non-homologous end joining protein LigD